MNLIKLVDTVKEAALSRLVVPEVTVITRDSFGRISMWWNNKPKLYASDAVLEQLWNSLNLKSGKWVSNGDFVNSVYIGDDPPNTRPFCRRYTDLKSRVDNGGDGEVSTTGENSPFVNNLLNKFLNGITPPEPVVNPHEIKISYSVEGLTFDSLEEAQDHIKCVKLFDFVKESDSEAEYELFMLAIEAMVKNPQKIIDILQGK